KTQVQTPVRVGKGTAVKHRVARPRTEPPGAQHLADLVAPCHNPLRIGVGFLERILEEDLAAGADIDHAVLRTGAEDHAEKLKLLGSRLVAEFLELEPEV